MMADDPALPTQKNVAPPGAGARPAFRADIEGLRGIAILAVIANHFGAEFAPGGFLGVDLFFVISGYVITQSLMGRAHHSLFSLATDFFARRIKRLTPALIIFVILTSALIPLVDPAPRDSLRTGLASLLALSNLHLLKQATDYFGGAAALNVFTHTWSLAVEDQFYLLFPLAVWAAGLAAGARREARLLVIVGVCGVASLMLFLVLAVTRPEAAFYLMPSRFWQIGAGAVLCLGQRSEHLQRLAGWRWLRRLPSTLHGAPLLLPIIVVFFIADDRSTLIAAPAIVALGVGIIGAERSGGIDHRILTSRPLLFLGRISYSLYLYHWSVITLSRWTIGVHAWTIPFQLALMLLLAWLSYRFVEEPLRHRRWSAASWRTIAMGLAAIAMACLCVMGIERRLAGSAYTGERTTLELKGGEPLALTYSVPGTALRWAGERCIIGAAADIGKAIDVASCTLGNFNDAPRRLLVIGDSFAPSFIAAFDEVARRGTAVTLAAAWGAAPAPGIAMTGTFAAMSAYYWQSVVPDLTRRLRRGDDVFIVADLEPLSPRSRSTVADEVLAHYAAQLRTLSGTLAAQGVTLYVLHGLPFARDAACTPTSASPQWFSPFGPPCRFLTREETLARRKALDDALHALSQARNARIVDLLDVFCPQETCTYYNGKSLLYRDEHSHPTIAGARLAAPIIAETFSR